MLLSMEVPQVRLLVNSELGKRNPIVSASFSEESEHAKAELVNFRISDKVD